MRTADDLLRPLQLQGNPFAKSMLAWYRSNSRNWPWRSKFAEHGDPYVIWISEIMLQQTTIQAVLPAYIRFLETFPNLYRLAHGTEEQIRQACRGLGYYRRFRMMHEAAKILAAPMENEDQKTPWPVDYLSWKELPGIGDYTAAAISSIAFGFPKAVVDGNVERVFCRLFNLQIAPDLKWKKVFQKVGDGLIPHDAASDFNQGLMELGQSICIKQNPKCSICPVHSFCAAYAEGTQTLAPAPKSAKVFEEVRIYLYIPTKRGRFGLLERKPSARFLKGNWSFPSAVERNDKTLAWETESVPTHSAQVLGAIKHSITKHKIELVVAEVICTEDIKEIRWVSAEEMEGQLVANLDRKAWLLYLKNKQRPPLETFFSRA